MHLTNIQLLQMILIGSKTMTVGELKEKIKDLPDYAIIYVHCHLGYTDQDLLNVSAADHNQYKITTQIPFD